MEKEYTVSFKFQGTVCKIQCKGNSLMKDVCERFKIKFDLTNNELLFIYNGEALKQNKTVNQMIFGDSSEIVVLVYDNGPKLIKEIEKLLKNIKDKKILKEIYDYILTKVDNKNKINPPQQNINLLSNNINNINEQISIDSNNSNDPNEPVRFTYSVMTDTGKRYMDIQDGETAGKRKEIITGIAIKANRGKVNYRVHVVGGDWLPYVSGYDFNDFEQGYAGNGLPIDLVQVTHDSVATKYRVSPYNKNFFDYQIDIIKNRREQMDGFAGEKGKAIDRFELTSKN